MGSRNDTPQVYWITSGEEQCIVGCFKGTLSELEKAVRETHRDNPKHLRNYLRFIGLVRDYQKSVNDGEVVN